MFTRTMWFFVICATILFSVGHVYAEDEKDLQDKYGYTLMDVPNAAKQGYFKKHGQNWEDTVYSDRMLFLTEWEASELKNKLRDEKLQMQLDRQKKAEEVRLQKKAMEKQKKELKAQAETQKKELLKEKEKLKIKKKHGSSFIKMEKMRAKQQRRSNQN